MPSLQRLNKMARSLVRRIRRPLRRRLRRHGMILMYHRVATMRADPWNLSVTPAHFGEHLEVLKRETEIVPLSHLEGRLTRGNRPVVALTFDDGYADNLHEALPLLERNDGFATFFLTTGYVDRFDPFWWDVLATLLLDTARLPTELALKIGATTFEWRANVPGADVPRVERDTLHRDLWSQLQVASEPVRVETLRALAQWAGTAPQLDRYARPMTRSEVRQLHASRAVEIGAHSIGHCALPSLSAAEQLREIAGSRQQCAELIGEVPSSFAYPFGAIGPDSRNLVSQAGFARACTCQSDLVWAGGDALLLPRFEVTDCDGDEFARRLRSQWLP